MDAGFFLAAYEASQLGFRVPDSLASRFALVSCLKYAPSGQVYLLTGADDKPYILRVAPVEAFERLTREHLTLRRLHDPAFPHPVACFREEGQVYLIREYIPGTSLSELVENGEVMPPARTVKFARQIPPLADLFSLHIADNPLDPLEGIESLPNLTELSVCDNASADLALLALDEMCWCALGRGRLRVTIPLGALLGAWMPVRVMGRIMEAAFLYPDGSAADGTVNRPFASLTVDRATGQVVAFAYCSVCDFADAKRFPLNARVRIGRPDSDLFERDAARNKAFRQIYEMLRGFVFAQTLAPDQQMVVQDFRVIFPQVVPLDLMPYYRMLAPDFFAGWRKSSHDPHAPERGRFSCAALAYSPCVWYHVT